MLSHDIEIWDLKKQMKSTIILSTLSDGAWHKIDDLSTETQIEKDVLLLAVNFFRDYGFIEISYGGEAVKLDKDYLKL